MTDKTMAPARMQILITLPEDETVVSEILYRNADETQYSVVYRSAQSTPKTQRRYELRLPKDWFQKEE